MKKYLMPLLVSIMLILACFNSYAADLQNATLKQNNDTTEYFENLSSSVNASVVNVYVDGVTGNDGWDGTSSTHTSGNVGPFKTITKGVDTLNKNKGGNLNIANGTYIIYDELTIQYNSNIYGENRDNTIIDGAKQTRIFMINGNIDVTIANLTIRNGKGDNDGGGIYNKGKLTLENCQINANKAGDGRDADFTHHATNGGNGGGIYNTGTLILQDSLIHDNSAGQGGDATEIHSPGKGGNGGGIYNIGTVTIANSSIFNNYGGTGGKGDYHNEKGGEGGSGGGIYNEGILTITGNSTNAVEIYNNGAGTGGTAYDTSSDGGDGGSGGAIYNKNNCNVTYAHIHDNKGGAGNTNTNKYNVDGGNGGNGGAIYNIGTLNLTNCSIHNNKAGLGHDGYKAGDGGNGGSGGAIYTTGILTITNCQINSNKAGDAGKGADEHVETVGPSTYNAGHGGNGGSGGAIYNTGALTITESSINTNTAGNGGLGGKGAAESIVMDGRDQIDIEDPGNGGNGGSGGAIYNSGTIISVTNSSINCNKAGNGGDGGLYSDQISLDLWYNVNPAIPGIGGSGGGIYSPGMLNRIENTTIIQNLAGNGGNGNPISRYPSENGGTGGNGGGLVIYNQIQVINCQITENNAGDGGSGGKTFIQGNSPSTKPGNGGNAGSGGGIYVYYDNSKSQNSVIIKISNSILDHNSGGNGGAGGIDDKSYSSLSNGGNGGNGGAISIVSAKISNPPNYSLCLELEESNITNNKAGTGGQPYLNGTSLSGSGGAIYSTDNHYFTVRFNRILNNTPQAVYLNLSVSNSYTGFINNWWGSNSEPINQVVGNHIESSYYTPWIVLCVNSNPNMVGVGENTTVTANLIMNSAGNNTLLDWGLHVPDGIPVIFSVDSGVVNPQNTVTGNGISNTVFTANSVQGVSNVSATVDNQTVCTSIEAFSALIEINKNVNVSNIAVDDTITVMVHVKNKGPDFAKNVVIRIHLPDGFEYMGANTSKGTYRYDPSIKSFIWSLGDVQIGDYYLYLNLKGIKTGTHIINSNITSNTHVKSIITPLAIKVVPKKYDQKTSTNPVNNEISMYNTGLPIIALILAILMVLAGLMGSRRK